VRVGQVLRPKDSRNFNLTLGVSAGLVLVYAVADYLVAWSPKRGLGLAFGIFAALAFVFEMSYPARRPAARPFFTAKNWIQAHVYLGVVALLAVVIHAGFSWPKGGFGWWLLVLSAWTTLTGLLGVWLQKWIPATLAEGLQVEALFERIPGLVDQLVAEADVLMSDASDVLERFYRQEVRDRLEKVSPSWGFLLDVRGGRERALEPFRRMVGFADAEEKSKVEDLMSIYTEKLELDAQHSLQGILRKWLWLHVPPAGVLMGLLVIHVFTWMWY
jgi:uncharacterized membrane protein (UPF0136 family)